MQIYINEISQQIDREKTVKTLRDHFKPEADIMILNGFPVKGEEVVTEGDRVVLIKRGEAPTTDELEALLVSRHTPGVHQKVKKVTVGIAGVGGLGSHVALALTRLGIGHLILADFDVVEPSNLNRQQYFIDQLGMPKVEALKEILSRINPYIEITANNVRVDESNLTEIFGQVDILVEAFDTPEAKAMLVNTALHKLTTVPIVAASGLAGYNEANLIQTRKVSDRLYLIGDLTSAAAPGWGLMPPRVMVTAGHQANQVLRLILNEEEEER